MAQYQIKLESGLYVGLFNFGRTYKACTKKAWLNIDDDKKAIELAKAFKGKLTKRVHKYGVVYVSNGKYIPICFCNNKKIAESQVRYHNENTNTNKHKVTDEWLKQNIEI